MITAALLAGSFAALVTRDPLVGLGVMLLIFAWRTLNDPSGPPILALAFTYQWLQVMCALIYVGLTGRRLADMVGCDYAPMVLVALGALTALNLGLALGIWVLRKRSERELAGEGTTEFRRSLFIVYLLVTLFGGALREWAWMIPGVTQALIGLLAARLAVLFLMFRRLARPPARRELFILLLAVETVLGFSGFFAVFSEAFMMAALAVFEHFDRRRPEQWIAGGAIVVVFVCVGIVWTGVKPDYRRAWRDPTFSEGSTAVRLEKMESLVGAWAVRGTDAMWEDVDKFASRAWGIYYQALALRRVPAMIPHEKGRLFAKAIAHVTNPRFLNPEKDEIRSDSESVRRYAGVWVAGTKQGTSIALGYVIESYIDFGLPLMYVPIFVYGFLLGAAFRGLRRQIRDPEIGIGTACAIFWPALYLYERSWLKTLGLTVTALVVVGAAAVLLDRVLYWRRG